MTWLKECDCTIKFFHKMANMRLISNTITNPYVEGVWMYDQMLIRDHIGQYYVNLYTELMPHIPVLGGEFIPVLGGEFNAIRGDQQGGWRDPFQKRK